MTQKYLVSGMTCAACAANVERAVKKVAGVEKVAVSLLQGSMRVEGAFADKQILQAVERAGYGCRLPGAEEAPASDAKTRETNDMRAMRRRLIASACFLVPLMTLSMGHMFGLPLPDALHGAGNELTFAFTQLLLSLPVALINYRYYTNGFKALLHRSPNMDSLIAIGSAAAYVSGIVAIYRIGYALGHNDPGSAARFAMELYFESGAMILTLITLGKYFETRSKGRTGDAIRALIDLAPKTALIERDGAQTEIPLSQVAVNDTVLVQPGAGIPVDGHVLSGESSVDESAMTGESIPVEAREGTFVRAGTINGQGFLRVRAEQVGADTTLSKIVRLVEDASASKAPIQRLADKIAGVFVPIVIAAALIACGVWLIAGADGAFAVNALISVLVISCPCALGLATPVAVMVGTGRAATLGVLFRNAEAIEIAHAVDTVVMDKTGTLTEGKPRVTDVEPAKDVSPEELIALSYALEQPSGHPLSGAIVSYARERATSLREIGGFQAIPGRGVRGTFAGKRALGGNLELMRENEIDVSALAARADALAKEGKTSMFFALDTRPMGLVAVADLPRHDSRAAVDALHALNVQTVMLTGDNERTARAVAEKMGIDRVIANVLPQDKERVIRELQASGKIVAMVGDGVNDAPALTRAQLGVAVGAGTDIAIESADVVLMKNSLLDVADALRLGRRTIRIIRENLFWAFFYNATLIPVAAGAFYTALGWQVNPMLGAAAMSLSSVCVVTNALRLFRFQPTARAVQPAQSGTTTKNGQAERIEEITKTEEIPMTTKTLHVKGMMCAHCVAHVQKALEALGAQAEVRLDEGVAIVKMPTPIAEETLRQAVADAGYEVTGID